MLKGTAIKRSWTGLRRLYATDVSSTKFKQIYHADPLDSKNDRLDTFQRRHLGPNPKDVDEMLKTVNSNYNDLSDFVNDMVPSKILGKKDGLKFKSSPKGVFNETAMLNHLAQIAEKNNYKVKNYIGKGYYDTILPPVIQRNVLECPEWYTSYTPYQPEISQGRLESLLNFQTVVSDLTGLPVANSSLLDEGTAAGEAMLLSYHSLKSKKIKKSSPNQKLNFIIDKNLHPQTKSVLKTRAKPFNIELLEIDFNELSNKEIEDKLSKELLDNSFGGLVQYPDTNGNIPTTDKLNTISGLLHSSNCLFSVATDLLALTLLEPPSTFGADICLGSSQRFGVPLAYGGPHAAFFSVTEKLNRKIPGRIVGVSKDRLGNTALRLALQTREQHIKRDKATSNICTAQALLANVSANYCVYHGPEGLKNIAKRVYGMTTVLANAISEHSEHKLLNNSWFDTLTIELKEGTTADQFLELALSEFNTNVFAVNNRTVSISFDEKKTIDDLEDMVRLFCNLKKNSSISSSIKDSGILPEFPKELQRKSQFLQNPVFNRYHTETAMLRYLHHLQSRDLSLANSMIPLGSCTMKLNSTVEMMPITWPQFANIHPFQPVDQVQGYKELITAIEEDFGSITGFHSVSLQPNSGAQGEYTGLRVIRSYLEDIGEGHRNLCLIPISAHGTNPASAAMCGLKVIPINCLQNGALDLADLKEKAEKYKDDIAAVMITYPSTYGLYEPDIKEAFDIVHSCGGQVYLDGANMNAQVGLTSPGDLGADVCHLNLHKTFAIPHGGGGPAGAPICVKEHLAPFLPRHDVTDMITEIGSNKSIDSVSSAPYGNALVLPISYAYVNMMGEEGLPFSTVIATLNSNYMMARLKEHYKIMFVNGEDVKHCAHEFIIDLREFKAKGIEAIDVAKRLQDYGFHAPTLAFPVPGTLMVEPTESENREELDRFVDSMISIRKEIDDYIAGKPEGMVIKNAPHPLSDLISSTDWETRGYTREQAAFPLAFLKTSKFWPTVARVDDKFGDTHLICTCPSVEEMAEE
ncbi:Glycine dehydrogenase (decarboxylating), mitochondrial [Nakaseomyces glabratus]|nr:Glycine dehydrogenase (decarboxylating), mitochondrial [Nakaseomyces glabratus]KTB26988.1 Glycine dehydrogenase (decarboxylating), mitochondrial [Nakaseomyces glabratus]